MSTRTAEFASATDITLEEKLTNPENIKKEETTKNKKDNEEILSTSTSTSTSCCCHQTFRHQKSTTSGKISGEEYQVP
jgi:hypothetical protein